MPVTFSEQDFQRLEETFPPDQLVRLYEFLTRRLHGIAKADSIVTTRLPRPALDHVMRLAVARRQCRSTLVRQAVVEFLQRNSA